MKRNQDIQNELQEMDSPLAQTSRSMPYHVPDGYFELLHERIKNTVIADSDVPDINALKDTVSTMEVPEGYFDTLPDKVLAAAKQQPTKTIELGGSNKSWAPLRWLATAIIVLGVVFSITQFSSGSNEIDVYAELSKIPTDSIENYLAMQIDDVDVESLENSWNSGTSTGVNTGLTESELEQYLQEADWNINY